VRTGVLWIVDLRTEGRLHDADGTRERGGRHEDVDPELRHIAFPDRLGEIDTGEVRAETERAADRLPHARAVESPGERVRDRVGDGPVVLVPRVERRHVVRFAAHDRADEARDPLGGDAERSLSTTAQARAPRSVTASKIARNAEPF